MTDLNEEIALLKLKHQTELLDSNDTEWLIVSVEKLLEKIRNPWIPVDERMPDEDEAVVLWHTTHIAAPVISRSLNSLCSREHFSLLCPDLTHWMPIPPLTDDSQVNDEVR